MIKISFGDQTFIVYRLWYQRLLRVPFEIGLALFAIYSGISGMFNFGASNMIFAESIEYPDLFHVVFIMAGFATIFGSAMGSRSTEGGGLISIIGALLTRMVVILITTGWNATSHNLLAISIIYILASLVRLYSLTKLEHYVIK